jgi:hypothetical protein
LDAFKGNVIFSRDVFTITNLNRIK